VASIIVLPLGRADDHLEILRDCMTGRSLNIDSGMWPTRANDIHLPSVATWFAYGDLADRIDQVADDLEALNRDENAASLRAVGLQLRRDMQKLESETELHKVDEPMIFGSIEINR
jgi:hypothetical protein